MLNFALSKDKKRRANAIKRAMKVMKFTKRSAEGAAAMLFGKMSLGLAKPYVTYCTRDENGHVVTFYVSIEETKGKSRYFVNANYSTFPREEGEDRISDKTYQNACRFFNHMNVTLAKHLF